VIEADFASDVGASRHGDLIGGNGMVKFPLRLELLEVGLILDANPGAEWEFFFVTPLGGFREACRP
jgi:hypothetical protein